PPHLVGERARALEVLAGGGLVCASAAAVAEPLPRPEARPEPIVLSRTQSPGLDDLAEELALAGYERVDPGQERGHFAARGGLAEAENELGALLRAENRVVVAFTHRGEALRTANLLRRVEARILEPGDPLPDEPELLFAVSPARRGFVWRDLRLALLPDTQV